MPIQKIWDIIKAETALIGKDPKAFYGAIMTGLLIVAAICLIKVGGWYKDSNDQVIKGKDLQISLGEKHVDQVVTMAQSTRRAWDTADKYKTLFNYLKDRK